MSCKDKHAVDFDEIGVSKLMVFYLFLFSVWYTLVGIFIHCSSWLSGSPIMQIKLITVSYFIHILVMYNIPKVKSYFLHTWMSLDIWWPRRSKIQTTFDSSIPANHFCVQAFLLASKTMNNMVIYQNKCFNLNYIPTKDYFLGWEKCLGVARLMKSVIKYIYWV